MERKLFLMAVFCLITICSYSQDKPYSLGIKAGMNLSNMDIEGTDSKVRLGYNFGVFGEYVLPSRFFFQTGLNLTSKGMKNEIEGLKEDINSDGLEDRGSFDMNWNAMYLELPILVGYKAAVTDNFNINFMVGPYFAYGIGGKTTVEFYGEFGKPDGGFEPYRAKDKTNTFSDLSLKRFDMGISAGLEAEYRKFTFGIGYEYGLLDISQGTNSIHSRNAFVSLGYKIF